MSMHRILTVIGARPQFVKAAVVSHALRKVDGVREIVVHTGQHYDRNMSGRFFEELEIAEPDHNLGIGSGSHGEQTGRMLAGLEQVMIKERPDDVLVYGDTNSTVAGALAAAKLHIPVAHVEAGLRSFNRRMPEEINRVVADHLSDLLFTPTSTAENNLRLEGIERDRIVPVGDVMYDAARYYAEKAARTSRVLETMGLTAKGYVLATIHRAENTDDRARLTAILEGLGRVSRQLPVLLPLHPRTRASMSGLTVQITPGLRLVDPVGYLDMTQLERHAAVIATDSGGVQKEAYFYGVPCVTLRDETEWVELVTAGANALCPPVDPDRISRSVLGAIGRQWQAEGLYGDGDAARKITECLVERSARASRPNNDTDALARTPAR
jgi:UDP-GlcNAc3NAcA epimerase